MITRSMMAIAPGSIELGIIPFDLYTTDQRGHLVLFCRTGYQITEHRLEILRSQERLFYIDGSELDHYLDYAKARIAMIASSTSIPLGDKVRIVHGAGRRTVADLLKHPASKEILDASTAFIESHARILSVSSEALIRMFLLSSSDHYTHSHSINVATFCLMLGQKFCGDDKQALLDLGLAGLLHDIGMAQIDQSIVEKQGPLTEDEWREIRRHPILGYEIALAHGLPQGILLAIRNHHERGDRSGYPDGLSLEETHLNARIVAVADVYDAITSKRAYREELIHVRALAEMIDRSSNLDQDVFDQLLEIVINNKELIEGFQKDRNSLLRLNEKIRERKKNLGKIDFQDDNIVIS